MAWEEKERNWGNRPDGWSLHDSHEEYERYLEAHWESTPLPRPDEYSFPVPDTPLRVAEIPDIHPIARRLCAEKSLRIIQYEGDRYELERLLGVTWPGTERAPE